MIYLSICIPTYNRSNNLRETIESIITQPEFNGTDEVEIVIADNCSTDDTETVANEYTAKYPSKIKYNRNSENILGIRRVRSKHPQDGGKRVRARCRHSE
ncbi:MAG: glycosyltransferase, partial [Sphingobacteriaceae bacterium]